MNNGSILNQTNLLERLSKGEIFQKNTWNPNNLRSVGYDLTMAEDLMIVPDPPAFARGRRYKRGEQRVKEVILHPGDVAFASSKEKICMPWDVIGNIGTKFSLTSRGMLLLTGFIIDPGFGLEKDLNGWVPKSDERVHFFLANVGSENVILIPGQTLIATILFFQIEEVSEKKYIESKGFKNIEHEFFSDHKDNEAGLVFFRNMADLKKDMIELGNNSKMEEQEIYKYKKETQYLINQFDKRLSGIESGSNQVLMFGVYLMSATILGVSLATILSLISQLKIILNRANIIILVVALIVLGVVVLYFMKMLSKTIDNKSKGRHRD